MTIVDCRGLLCPEPVLRVRRELEKMPAGGVLQVMADSPAARDNVARLAKSLGWAVSVGEEEGEFRLELRK